jgi:cyclopropane fatty-acyl-phospholipid synthase-like methyltransferase
MVNPILIKDFRKLKEDWDIAAQTQYFRDYIAQGFNEEEAFKKSGESNTNWIKDFLALYNVSWKSKRVVELGCGAGRMTEFIAQEASLVQAVDISAEMIKRLRERLGRQRNIEPLCIIRDYSVISDLSADLIISFLVFQHTPEDMVERLIEDGRRILKQGGYYFFQIPLSETHKCHPCNDANALDMVYWTLEEIKELAIKYRFEIIHFPKDMNDQFFLFKKTYA